MNTSRLRRGRRLGASAWIALAAFACVSPRDADRREGVLCSGCEAAWFLDESGGSLSSDIDEYRTLTGMECGSCRSAVHNFFVTGELRHFCALCEGNLKRCLRS